MRRAIGAISSGSKEDPGERKGSESPVEVRGKGLLNLRFDLAPGAEDQNLNRVKQGLFPRLLASPGVLSGRLFRGIYAATNRAMEQTPDRWLVRHPRYLLAVELEIADIPHTIQNDTLSQLAVYGGTNMRHELYDQILPVQETNSADATASRVRNHPVGSSRLQVLCGAEPGWDKAVVEWYEKEHFPAKITLPGYLDTRLLSRVGEVDHGQRLLAIYELESLAALSRSSPKSEWDARIYAHFIWLRTAYEEV